MHQTHADLRHPFKSDHGPFTFHRCSGCGSGLTVELPSRAQLESLYASYGDGLPDLHRTITQDDPQHALYGLSASRLLHHAGVAASTPATWLDIGAGGGELSRILAARLPHGRGIAVDLHDRPTELAGCERVEWRNVDINDDHFAPAAGEPADLVASMAVWEHVLHPDRFVGNLIRLVKPGGVLYLLCPDYGSLARRVFAGRWPYFTPGEHLNMPTAAGARACLTRQWRVQHDERSAPEIRSGSLWLPYTFRYVFRRLGWDGIGRRLPARLGVPLPVGALETVLRAPSP